MFGNIVHDVKKTSDLMIKASLNDTSSFLGRSYNILITKNLVNGVVRLSEPKVATYVGEITQALIDEHRKFEPNSKEGSSVKKVLDIFNMVDVEKLSLSAKELLSEVQRLTDISKSEKHAKRENINPIAGAPIQNSTQIEKKEIEKVLEKNIDEFHGLFMCLGSALRMSEEKMDFRWYLISNIDKNLDSLDYFKKDRKNQ